MEERFRSIDLDRWPRREHYENVRQYGLPFFSITTVIDVTSLRNTIRERSSSFTIDSPMSWLELQTPFLSSARGFVRLGLSNMRSCIQA